MAKKRIYIVEEKKNDDDSPVRLVKATTKAQALNHVAEKSYAVEVAGQDKLVEAVGLGINVEEAGKEVWPK